MIKNKILIIDDDEDFLEATAALLQAKGYQPICASNGQDGFQMAKTDSPDLIFLDLVMAYEDEGARIAEAMASDGAIRDIPVILVTGMKQKPGFKSQTVNLPVKAVLDKPVSPHELLKTVRTYM
ncbi:MAG: response regulator, partial [Candidatus Omnitrophica bacterium]|nr:response regulator [Candidatus Omnitrophota bacterium]